LDAIKADVTALESGKDNSASVQGGGDYMD
jgi:hypothetical protein